VEKRRLVNLNVKIPATMKRILLEFVKNDLHVNISEFAREALREKLQREAPGFYKLLLSEEGDKS